VFSPLLTPFRSAGFSVNPDYRKRNMHGDAYPRIVSEVTWQQMGDVNTGQLQPPAGVGWREWVCCMDGGRWFPCDDSQKCVAEYTPDANSIVPINLKRWSPRRGHKAVTIASPDGIKIVVLGGRARSFEDLPSDQAVGGLIVQYNHPNKTNYDPKVDHELSILTSDTWISSDGNTWLLTNGGCYVPQADLSPPPGTRAQVCASDSDCFKKGFGDSQCSSGTCVCRHWSPREYFAATAQGMSIFVAGGITSAYGKNIMCGDYNCASEYSIALSDVWVSVNFGASWSMLTPVGSDGWTRSNGERGGAPWGPRTGHHMLFSQNRLWIFGGRLHNPRDHTDNALTNDVWISENGERWFLNGTLGASGYDTAAAGVSGSRSPGDKPTGVKAIYGDWNSRAGQSNYPFPSTFDALLPHQWQGQGVFQTDSTYLDPLVYTKGLASQWRRLVELEEEFHRRAHADFKESAAEADKPQWKQNGMRGPVEIDTDPLASAQAASSALLEHGGNVDMRSTKSIARHLSAGHQRYLTRDSLRHEHQRPNGTDGAVESACTGSHPRELEDFYAPIAAGLRHDALRTARLAFDQAAEARVSELLQVTETRSARLPPGVTNAMSRMGLHHKKQYLRYLLSRSLQSSSSPSGSGSGPSPDPAAFASTDPAFDTNLPALTERQRYLARFSPWMPRAGHVVVADRSRFIVIGGQVEILLPPVPPDIPPATQVDIVAANVPTNRYKPLPAAEIPADPTEYVMGAPMRTAADVWILELYTPTQLQTLEMSVQGMERYVRNTSITRVVNQWYKDFDWPTPASSYIASSDSVRKLYRDDPALMQVADRLAFNDIKTFDDLADLSIGMVQYYRTYGPQQILDICYHKRRAQAIRLKCGVNFRVPDHLAAAMTPFRDASTLSGEFFVTRPFDGCIDFDQQAKAFSDWLGREKDAHRTGYWNTSAVVGPLLEGIFGIKSDDWAVVCRQRFMPRRDFGATMLDNVLYVFGGYEDVDNYNADLWYRDERWPSTLLLKKPEDQSSETLFDFAADEPNCMFEYRMTNSENGVITRDWAPLWGPWDAIEAAIPRTRMQVEFRAVDPAGNRDPYLEVGRNVHLWTYIPPFPWIIIILLIVFLVLSMLIAFYVYRRYRRRKALAAYLERRKMRKQRGNMEQYEFKLETGVDSELAAEIEAERQRKKEEELAKKGLELDDGKGYDAELLLPGGHRFVMGAKQLDVREQVIDKEYISNEKGKKRDPLLGELEKPDVDTATFVPKKETDVAGTAVNLSLAPRFEVVQDEDLGTGVGIGNKNTAAVRRALNVGQAGTAIKKDKDAAKDEEEEQLSNLGRKGKGKADNTVTMNERGQTIKAEAGKVAIVPPDLASRAVQLKSMSEEGGGVKIRPSLRGPKDQELNLLASSVKLANNVVMNTDDLVMKPASLAETKAPTVFKTLNKLVEEETGVKEANVVSGTTRGKKVGLAPELGADVQAPPPPALIPGLADKEKDTGDQSRTMKNMISIISVAERDMMKEQERLKEKKKLLLGRSAREGEVLLPPSSASKVIDDGSAGLAPVTKRSLGAPLLGPTSGSIPRPQLGPSSLPVLASASGDNQLGGVRGAGLGGLATLTGPSLGPPRGPRAFLGPSQPSLPGQVGSPGSPGLLSSPTLSRPAGLGAPLGGLPRPSLGPLGGGGLAPLPPGGPPRGPMSLGPLPTLPRPGGPRPL
jgi:hypothetical protein